MRMIQNDEGRESQTRFGASGAARLTLSLMAAVAVLSLATPLRAANDPAATPPTETTAPRARPANQVSMDFQIVEGRGLFGQNRWIQASGPITAETADRFDQFARTNRIAGMTVVLDSPGGSMTSGLRMGRAFRAAGVNTMIGRTVIHRQDGRATATLISHGVICASACSYALLGGVQRTIASTASFGVHQFSRKIGSDGRFVTETPSAQDFEAAQRLTASLAVYVQEMGVDAGLLPLAASMPHGGQLRFLTTGEIGGLRVAMPAVVNEADRGAVAWSANPRADAPMLFRRIVQTAPGDRRLDQELSLGCHQDPTMMTAIYRVINARTGDNRPLKLGELKVDVAGFDVLWRTSAAPLEARGPNSSIWVRVLVPRAELEKAAQRGALAVDAGEGVGLEGRSEFGEGLAQPLQDLLAACDTLRATVTAGR